MGVILGVESGGMHPTGSVDCGGLHDLVVCDSLRLDAGREHDLGPDEVALPIGAAARCPGNRRSLR